MPDCDACLMTASVPWGSGLWSSSTESVTSAWPESVIRQASQSGIANRYVELELPPGDKQGRKPRTIADGGMIPITSTTTAVDLDQLFNTLDPRTRTSIKALFTNSAAQFKGKTKQQREAYRYLNPALSTSSRLFGELNRDSPLLSRFLQDSSTLVGALAEKRNELAAFIGNANTTFRALTSQRLALEEAISRLPDFMRQANTTFVNLRAALNDVDPLVNASKPVAKKLGPFLKQLRPLARDARPTIRDLARVVLYPGKNNDLLNLEQSFPALASAALDTKKRFVNYDGGKSVSVGKVKGAFPETVKALKDTAPTIAFGRPYTPELFGWFDDFSTTGPTDAEGGFSRVYTILNVFDLSNSAAPSLIPLASRGEAFTHLARVGQFRKCPGAAESIAPDKSNVISPELRNKLNCTETARETGNIP
ncbi:MAG: phospholipid/cholesterol/gamma-HCH transport system substrate-binding protein [Thermoleophilaceae bacterium]|nr:phospholipid/cholesterol/gamma-HCH transport system substrate-binding protein [Thermoleophilaceae bacterium]